MEPLTLADRFRSGAPESAKTRSILTRRARRPSDTDKPTCDVMLLEEEAKVLRTLAYATLFSAAIIGPGAYGADDARALVRNSHEPARAHQVTQQTLGVC